MADDSVSRPVGNRFGSATDEEICDEIWMVINTERFRGSNLQCHLLKVLIFNAKTKDFQKSYQSYRHYLRDGKTVACKQHCRLEPRNLSVFITIQISSQISSSVADPKRFPTGTCILVIFYVSRLSPGIFNYACPNFRNTCVNGADVYTLNSMSLISQRFFQFHPTVMLVAYVNSKTSLLFFSKVHPFSFIFMKTHLEHKFLSVRLYTLRFIWL
jgi:hypothetical protein